MASRFLFEKVLNRDLGGINAIRRQLALTLLSPAYRTTATHEMRRIMKRAFRFRLKFRFKFSEAKDEEVES